MSWDPNPWPRDPRVRRGLALIGDAVRRRRLRNGWSQRDLQSLTHIDQGAISRLENGKLNGLRWQRFARIVDALDGLEYAASPRERPPWPGGAPEPTNTGPTNAGPTNAGPTNAGPTNAGPTTDVDDRHH